MTNAPLDMRAVAYAYPHGPAVLDGFDLTLTTGETVLVSGASGSGKSTLLNLVCGMLVADSGRVVVDGTDLAALPASRRDRFRARHLGVVFQQFNLVPYLGVLENVLLPLRLGRASIPAPRERANALLAALGLDPALIDRPVTRLSVGQQQRVAAARAFIAEPALVVADEPTSALDPARRDDFMSLMLDEAQRTGAAVLCVSHDDALCPLFDRVVSL